MFYTWKRVYIIKLDRGHESGEKDLRIKRERSLKDMCDVKAEGGIVG